MESLPLYQNEAYIRNLLDEAQGTPAAERARILDKAAHMQGLSHREAAALLAMESEADWQRLFAIAGAIKSHIYGDRVVMFAPLYISDYCVNDCAYCGFGAKNKAARRRLTMDEIRREVALLEAMGHKRLALEAGEDPENCPLSYVLEAIQTIYDADTENGEIRRVNVNIAAQDVEGYRQLKAAGIGTIILFQESYHRPTYGQMHRSGPKSDYDYHAGAFDRAMEAGLDDVGGGVLFGLYEPRYEVLGLMLHNEHLESRFGVGFHTLSAPRIRAFGGQNAAFPSAVDDETFLRMVAVMRLAVPFTGIIISTRESPEMRRRLIKMGVSQLSGGSAVEVGGYHKKAAGQGQFQVADERSPEDIIRWLMGEGFIPSFCTACYRSARTGDRFMALAKSGDIKDVCLPNALITLVEYAEDYGSEALRRQAAALVEEKWAAMPEGPAKERTRTQIDRVCAGERDIRV